ncbi:hypothetical protein FSP39_000950 [Pinctada imbricata]|uniref:Uncharacterized protein n=1 Tax=Pinctada imbricata TaxID=66713 RepID=A0AA89C887_PINIB|nr:hypothetical protein FSP39_000950 [Pinctada imbricata]
MNAWMRLDSRAMRLETRGSRHRQRAWTDSKTTLKFPGIFRPKNFEVEVRKFNLYGTLRKSKTEIHNTLPSPELIEREIKYIEFDQERRVHPHTVEYKEFYRYLTPTLKHRPTSLPKIF